MGGKKYDICPSRATCLSTDSARTHFENKVQHDVGLVYSRHIPFIGLTLPRCCACPKPEFPELLTIMIYKYTW